MVNTSGPEMRKLNEEGDKGGGKFANDDDTASVGQGPDEPADETLQELLCVVLGQR